MSRISIKAISPSPINRISHSFKWTNIRRISLKVVIRLINLLIFFFLLRNFFDNWKVEVSCAELKVLGYYVRKNNLNISFRANTEVESNNLKVCLLAQVDVRRVWTLKFINLKADLVDLLHVVHALLEYPTIEDVIEIWSHETEAFQVFAVHRGESTKLKYLFAVNRVDET